MTAYADRARRVFTKHMTELGNPSNDNANGDYSVTPASFEVGPGDGEVWGITRLVVSIEGSPGFRAERYGPLTTALTNGIAIEKGIYGGASLGSFTDSHAIKSNADWAHYVYNCDVKSWGAGNDIFVAEWSSDRNGYALLLNGSQSEVLRAVMNDDLTGITSHHYIVHGFIDAGDGG